MRILGIDPGFGRMGWAIVEGNKSKQSLVVAGCLETSPDDSLSVRLVEIYDHVEDLINKHNPEAVAVEDIFYFKNAKTVIDVSQARGVILLAIVKNSLPYFGYTPLQVKNTVAGYGKAEKKQVQMMVKSQLRLASVPKPDDAADACAIALTHFFSSEKLKIKNKS